MFVPQEMRTRPILLPGQECVEVHGDVVLLGDKWLYELRRQLPLPAHPKPSPPPGRWIDAAGASR